MVVNALFDELRKIAETQVRSSSSSWGAKTIGAPRSKLTGVQLAKAPTLPGKLHPKLIGPASQFGKRQNYSQPNVDTLPSTNPAQGAAARQLPPPNVVFGVR